MNSCSTSGVLTRLKRDSLWIWSADVSLLCWICMYSFCLAATHSVLSKVSGYQNDPKVYMFLDLHQNHLTRTLVNLWHTSLNINLGSDKRKLWSSSKELVYVETINVKFRDKELVTCFQVSYWSKQCWGIKIS